MSLIEVADALRRTSVHIETPSAMLVNRTISKKVFWEFDSIVMQNLPLFCTPTWSSHRVSENHIPATAFS